MNRTAIAIKNSLKNNIRSKIAIAGLLSLSVMIIGIGLILVIKYVLLPALAKNDIEAVRRFFSLLMYGISLMGFGLCTDMFIASLLMKEKVTGIYESLLATPLSVRQLWMAKIFSVFIPALIFAEFCTAAAFVLIQYLFVNPVFGHVLSFSDLFPAFFIIPLIYFFLIALSLLIGLSSSPIAGNFVAQIFLGVFAPLSINLAARTAISATSLNFILFNSCFALAGIILVLLLLPKLKKENVVLSARK